MQEKATKTLKQAANEITRWYAAVRRPLPWRIDPTPYHIWISEIMLQQTRIEAVIPYYQRFLSQIPSVEALAKVEEEKLLKLWEGLGYYSRARNLKKAAIQLVEQFDGQLPIQVAQLRTLPGIGEYTAGAISSIAYGQPEPAVDGNVLRVLSRLLEYSGDIMAPKNRRELTELWRNAYTPDGENALLTEGIMELGETICLPNGEPHCDQCPLFSLCKAAHSHTTALYPIKAPKKERKVEKRTVMLLKCGERYALRRRPDKGLLAGMWEPVQVEGHLNENQVLQQVSEWGCCPAQITPCGNATHIFSHIEWHMIGFWVECEKQNNRFEWKTLSEINESYSIPTAFSYYRKKMN